MVLKHQFLGSAAAGGIAACIVVATARSGESRVVAIEAFMFKPPQMTVSVGSQVTWENHDDVPHTIVATGGAFRSRAVDTGDQFSLTFDRPGQFAYFCSLHPQMKGEIAVVP